MSGDNKKNKLTMVVLMFMAVVASIFMSNNVNAESGKDITNKVTFTKVDVEIRLGSEWHYIIKDGVEVADHPSVHKHNNIRFSYNWEITDSNMTDIQADDYFKIPLPEEYFKFEDTGEYYDLKDSQGGPAAPAIGKWTVKSNEIVATLNSIGANKNNITNGYFTAAGTVTKSGSNIVITAPGIVLPPFDIDEDDDISEIEHDNFGHLNKHGGPIGNKNQINWGMFVNYQNYKNAYEGKDFDPINNVMLTDDLEPGQTINEAGFEVAVKMHTPTNDGKMSQRVMIYLGITEQFEKITSNDGESYEDFYNRIKAHSKPAYGFHNGNRAIVSFKNLNGDGNGIKLNHLVNDTTLNNELQSRVNSGEITQKQADGMFAAYSQSSKSNGDALGFMVNIVADVSGGTNDYKNTATFSYDNNKEVDSSASVKFQEMSGGAQSGKPGDMVITKEDNDTNEKLKGVVFKLQKDDGTENYVDYTPRDQISEKITNDYGQVVFGNLHNGKYKIVEVKGLPGYTSQVTYSPSEFFEIDGSETAGVQIKALNYKSLGSVTLTKVDKDSNEKLEGAEFELQDENGVKISDGHKTNASGELTIDNLAVGKYKLVETKAPTGYILNKTALDFEIKSNQSTPLAVTFENSKDVGSVALTKIDKESKAKLSGAEFELQKDDGTKISDGHTTGTDGKLKIDGLEPGVYQFVETKAPEGYILNQIPVKFRIVANQTSVYVVVFENVKDVGSVTLTKVDKDSNEKLEGAEFELQDENGVKISDGHKTNASGELTIDNLAVGKYKLVETKAPTGYVLNKTALDFEIKSNQSTPLAVTFENSKDVGSVALTKIDKESKAKLSGAEFELQKDDGTKISDGHTTGTDGKLKIDGLEPGVYQFVETKAPEGYILNQTPVKFRIVANQTSVYVVVFENVKDVGSVILTKVDKDTNNNLEGAEFELQDENGTKISDDYITDANGELRIDGLEPGKYQFIETKAPTGYVLNKKALKFEIEKNQTTALELTFENEKINNPDPKDPDLKEPTLEKPKTDKIVEPKKPIESDNNKMPKTGSQDLVVALISGISLFSVAGVYILKRKNII